MPGWTWTSGGETTGQAFFRKEAAFRCRSEPLDATFSSSMTAAFAASRTAASHLLLNKCPSILQARVCSITMASS